MSYRLIAKVCESCGSSFLGIPRRRFCSRPCVGLVPFVQVACAWCGRSFRRMRPKARFCSMPCANLARRTRPPGTCPKCSREFRLRFAGQKYCSTECAKSGRARAVKECAQCSIQFVGQRNQRFCSKLCSDRWHRAHRTPRPAKFEATCEICKSTFGAKDKRHRFCSPQCSWASRRAKNRRLCAWCGGEFGFLDKRQRFCSRRCALLGKKTNRGENNYNWNGGRTKTAPNGYIRVRAPDHPRTRASSPYVLEHILVMEGILGRYLLPNERVHHKNGRRDDNRPENLELWKMKDPPGVRSADYHCPGCTCDRNATTESGASHAISEELSPWRREFVA